MAIDFSDPLFLAPAKKKGNKKRGSPRGGAICLVPARSARLYVHIAPSQVHLFRFFLEAHDNLGVMTLVDRWRAVMLLRFSPHQKQEMRDFLEEAKESVPISVLSLHDKPGQPVSLKGSDAPPGCGRHCGSGV